MDQFIHRIPVWFIIEIDKKTKELREAKKIDEETVFIFSNINTITSKNYNVLDAEGLRKVVEITQKDINEGKGFEKCGLVNGDKIVGAIIKDGKQNKSRAFWWDPRITKTTTDDAGRNVENFKEYLEEEMGKIGFYNAFL